MKVVVSATNPSLESPVDPRFGRCSYFIFVDMETRESDIQQNESAMSGSGAGIQAAQYVVEQGAKAVVTGHLGPNAYQVLDAAGLDLYQAQNMTVEEALDAFEADTLTQLGDATGPAHAGMGMGGGRGRAGAGGRIGLDRQAATVSAPPEPESSEGMTTEEELAALKREVADLREAVASLLDQVDRITRER